MTDNEAQHPPGHESRFFYGYLIVALSFLIMVVSIGAHNSFGVFLKPILTEFGWTRAMTSAAFSLSMIVSGLLGVLVGGLNDRFGPRAVLTVCGCFLGLGYVLISQIGALWQFYLGYGIIIGIGMAGAWVPIVSTVARWFVKRRGIMTGLVVAGQGIGTLIAPPIANQLISTYGWRMSFIVLGSVVLVVVVLAVQFLRREPSQNGATADDQDENEVIDLKSTPASLTFTEALRTTQFWLLTFMLFCFGFCMFSIIIHIAPHATELGVSRVDAANILGTAGGLSIVGNAILGLTADKSGNKKTFAASLILMSAILVWLALATSQWQLYLFACVFGFAYGGLATIESPLAAELFGLKSHGLIYGIASIGFTVGAAVGPVITGHIFDITDSYKTAFLVCAAVSAVGFILASILKPTGIESSNTTAS
jgi:MFS family permease